MDMPIDPDTKFLVRFNDVDCFKNLIIFMDNIIIEEDIYFSFTNEYVFLSYRSSDTDPKTIFNLDIFCKLSQYNLTKHYYKSSQDVFIVGINAKKFNSAIKSRKKYQSYFQIKRKEGAIYTSKSKKDSKFIKEVSNVNYKHYEELEYKTPETEPFCVIPGKEFCDACQELKGLSSSVVEIYICEQGIVILGPDFSEDTNIIVSGDIQQLGKIPKNYSKNSIKCATSKNNLVKLSKLEKMCPKGNVRMYLERNESGELMPLKISCDIGNIGTINVYLEINEKKD